MPAENKTNGTGRGQGRYAEKQKQGHKQAVHERDIKNHGCRMFEYVVGQLAFNNIGERGKERRQ